MAKRNASGAGMIRRRPDGRWEARYTVGRNPGTGNQIQKSVYALTEGEVRRKLTAKLHEIDEGAYIPESATMTFEQWLHVYMQSYTMHLTDNTLTDYKYYIKTHIVPRLGRVKLNKLTQAMISNFYAELLRNGRIQREYVKKDGTVTRPPLKSKGLSVKTVKNIHSVVHHSLRIAASPQVHLIRFNPADGIMLPKYIQPEMKTLPDCDITAFMEETKKLWYHPIYMLMLLTGLRRGEDIGIIYDDKHVNLDEGWVFVEYQLQQERSGKKRLRLTPLKNKRPRKARLGSLGVQILREYLLNRDALKHDAGDNWCKQIPFITDSGDIEMRPGELLFCDIHGNPLYPGSVYEAYKRLLKKYNITETRLHDLRHTYARLALKSEGCDIKTLQESLGHADPGFTLRKYGHTEDERKASLASAVDNVVSNLSAKTKTDK